VAKKIRGRLFDNRDGWVAGRIRSGPDVDPSVFRATIHGHGDVRYVKVGPQPDELVRLTQGTITVQVSPLSTHERFRVIVGDSQVEVKGTVFDVTAINDKLDKVRVISGMVIVRHKKQVVILVAGDQWRSPKSQAAAVNPETVSHQQGTPLPKSTLKKPRRVVSKRRTPKQSMRDRKTVPEAGAAERPAEKAFRLGWQYLRQGDAVKASVKLREARGTDGAETVADDASYWLGIAYSQAGDIQRASSALSDFIARYPCSPRRGEAKAILGWHCIKQGDVERARRLFEDAALDPSPNVRSSATKGLTTVRERHRRR
jgi:hypothetical protein